MVENLPIINELVNMKYSKIPKKYLKHIFTLMLNSFFEDLESAVYTKISLEQRKSKKK